MEAVSEQAQVQAIPVPPLSRVGKARGAFLGAAVGDALGWPQEDRAHRIDQSEAQFRDTFIEWTRSTGGRFQMHRERILPGEYSDDTQLLLCTARSILHGKLWWKHFTLHELPAWSLYQRGAGAAVGRAANAWLTGQAPWLTKKAKERDQYYVAGGNGVAMRILPHVITGAEEASFDSIASVIMANGVATHGHPRALVGALAYGYGVWLALRQEGTLAYGALIKRLLNDIEIWGRIPDLSQWVPEWHAAADAARKGAFQREWEETVGEQRELLSTCGQAMEQGALAVDLQVLERLGAFNRRVSGAGTIAAAASLFLASRCASDPLQGIVQAAFAVGSDTDTIASMTGGLLGVLAGSDWLGELSIKVQDHEYLSDLAARVAKPRVSNVVIPTEALTPSQREVRAITTKLAEMQPGQSVRLPDRREATLKTGSTELEARTKNVEARAWKLVTEDGQTVYIKQLTKAVVRPSELSEQKDTSKQQSVNGSPTPPSMGAGVRIPVRDLERIEAFYSRTLGLQITKKTANALTFAGTLNFVESPEDAEITQRFHGFVVAKGFSLFVHMPDLETVYQKVRDSGAPVLADITQRRGVRRFRCMDPAGNLVDLHEAATLGGS
jgi:ADP-ribosylglycohydrolase/predicted enzyme related to lactoylglutathione lyase